MKKFFSFIVKKSVAIILVIVFVLGFGVYSTSSMAINLLPDINVPMVCVQVVYPGASAASVEEDVTSPLEEGLSAISGVTGVDSYSYDNLSAVVLSFDYGTDTSEKKSDITDKLGGIALPDDCTTTVYDIDLNSQALAVLSVTGGEDLSDTYEKANRLKTALSAIEGVESVEVLGGGDKVISIVPYVGAELISLLLVQALSYDALDIPLGSLTTQGGEVQVRNDSAISSFDDVVNAPVSLPSSFVALLSSVKQVAQYYEDSSTEDLEQLRSDLDGGVAQVLRELDGMSYEEIDTLARLKTYMNIADAYTADQLKTVQSSKRYSQIESEVEGKTDEELNDLAEDISNQLGYTLSADLLKVVRDKKLKDIITYREWLETTDGYKQAEEAGEYYELTDEDYLVLARSQNKEINGIETLVGMNVYGDAYSDAEVVEKINFVKQTSATGLATIADKKKEEGDGYVPTDEECALLFTATTLSSEHPVVMSPTFMAFVRSPNYESNMQLLIDRREPLGTPISAEGYYDLYNDLVLDDVLEVTLSVDLIGFILDTDLSDLTTAADGSSVLVVSVGDIANVTETEEYSSYAYYYGGEMNVTSGIIINIYKSNGANSSAVVSAVKQVYEAMAGEEGFSVQVSLLDDQSEFISDSISNVLVSMLIGGLLAVIIIFVFLKKIKPSLIIAVTMPLSVLAALICMFAMGITLNMVSLGGLAVGIGMLVDNSIVVIEAISKHRDMGKTAYRAAVDGCCEVGGALIGSTITTVCVFIPILFSGGLTGEIFADLAWAVIFSLSFSLLVAVTVIPTLYSLLNGGDKQMLKAHSPAIPLAPQSVQGEGENSPEPADNDSAAGRAEEKRFKRFCSKLSDPFLMRGTEKFYKRILPAVLSKKIITVCVAVAVFGASIFLVTLTGTEFLPSMDKGQIEIDMSYGATAQIEDVQEDVLNFTNILKDNVENIDYLSASVGKNGLLALTDTGIITIQLTTNRNTAKVVEQIRELAADSQLLGDVTVSEIDGVVASLLSGSSGLSVSILGEDSEKLSAIAKEITARLNENGFTDVTDSLNEKTTQYLLDFNEEAVARYGLDYTTLITTLRVGIASYTAATVEIEGQSYSLKVQFSPEVFGEEDSKTVVEKLASFIVGYDGSEAIHLKDVLNVSDENAATYGITVEETDACIRRSNGYNTVSVTAQLPGVDTGTAGALMQKIAAEVLAAEEYADYSFESSGVSSYLTDAFDGLAVALVISFFLLYAVMAVQFSSFVKPIIIMASIPFCFTGGFIALVITGTSLNVVSFIGLIMLMGVIVNNAIVMLEKIKQLHDEGMPHYRAVQSACAERLRPILMTTLTTILALIPMAIGIGKGSELMQPLGIVVMGGLLVGTLVTLLLVPAVYCLFNRLSAKYPEGKKRKKIKQPESENN